MNFSFSLQDTEFVDSVDIRWVNLPTAFYSAAGTGGGQRGDVTPNNFESR